MSTLSQSSFTIDQILAAAGAPPHEVTASDLAARIDERRTQLRWHIEELLARIGPRLQSFANPFNWSPEDWPPNARKLRKVSNEIKRKRKPAMKKTPRGKR